MSSTSRNIATILTFTLTLALMATGGAAARAQEASGGPIHRFLGRFHHAQPTAAVAAPVQGSAQYTPPTASCECPGGADPYGFAGILNRIRAAAGLHPLAYDPNLSSWASRNNSAQCWRGLGHHVNPCGVQNCGWNYSDANSVAQGWLNSPGHRENMLSPSVTRFGIAYGPGPYWTLNAQ